MHMFDFNHTKLVFSSNMIGIKPITIDEHFFKILIPGKVILDYVFNDPIVLRFESLCINDPHNNSIDVILTATFGSNTFVRELI
jgi:hypothetical protein